MKARKQIFKEIERSLPLYDEWKMNPRSVNPTSRAYLEMLSPAVERYVDGLVPPERDAVEYYLAGIKLHAVLGMSKIKRAKVTRADLNKWLVGDNTQWGLLQTLFRIFASRMNYCPFCHSGPRWSGTSPHPKVNGSVCDHQARWWAEEMKEGKE